MPIVNMQMAAEEIKLAAMELESAAASERPQAIIDAMAAIYQQLHRIEVNCRTYDATAADALLEARRSAFGETQQAGVPTKPSKPHHRTRKGHE